MRVRVFRMYVMSLSCALLSLAVYANRMLFLRWDAAEGRRCCMHDDRAEWKTRDNFPSPGMGPLSIILPNAFWLTV